MIDGVRRRGDDVPRVRHASGRVCDHQFRESGAPLTVSHDDNPHRPGMTSITPGDAAVTRPPEDPLVRDARREAAAVALVAIVATAYTVGYCALFGYGREGEPIRFVLGFPSWVFWGILAPWGVCVLISDLVLVAVHERRGPGRGPRGDGRWLSRSPDRPSAGWAALAMLFGVVVASVWLGTLASRAARGGSSRSYFLGNRGLGAWALALTATVQSGGTFMGFPSWSTATAGSSRCGSPRTWSSR